MCTIKYCTFTLSSFKCFRSQDFNVKHNYSTYTNLMPAIATVASTIFVRFRQRNRVEVGFYQFRKTGFGFDKWITPYKSG